jgi:heme-binding protein
VTRECGLRHLARHQAQTKSRRQCFEASPRHRGESNHVHHRSLSAVQSTWASHVTPVTASPARCVVISLKLIKESARLMMKKVLWILLLAFMAVQFIPVSKTNPAVSPSQTLYATHSVPPNIQSILDRSCRDCHSNETVWPWYSQVAPASWLVSHDVKEARKEVNLSLWGTYNDKRKKRKLEEMCEQVREGDMPDSTYTLIHRNARLTPEERAAICAWTDALGKSLPSTESASSQSTVPSSQQPH